LGEEEVPSIIHTKKQPHDQGEDFCFVLFCFASIYIMALHELLSFEENGT
jgi:hypothetical protein